MTPERQAILDKIRKLISKRDSAEKIGNMQEAQAFAAKIQELLLKYNLEISELPQEEDSGVTESINQRLTLERRHEGDWVIKLGMVLCKYNFCFLYIRGNFDGYKYLDGQMVIAGEPHNIEIVKYLLEHLVISGRQMGKDALKRNPGEKRNSFLRAFYSGYCGAIYTRLKEQYEKDHTEHGETMALVVQNSQVAIKDYFEKKGMSFEAGGKSRGYGNNNGRIEGHMAGKKVTMNKAVTGNKNSLNQNLLG